MKGNVRVCARVAWAQAWVPIAALLLCFACLGIAQSEYIYETTATLNSTNCEGSQQVVAVSLSTQDACTPSNCATVYFGDELWGSVVSCWPLSTNLTSTLEPGDYIEKMYLSSGSCGNDSSIVQYGVWTAPSACFFDPIDGSYEMMICNYENSEVDLYNCGVDSTCSNCTLVAYALGCMENYSTDMAVSYNCISVEEQGYYEPATPLYPASTSGSSASSSGSSDGSTGDENPVLTYLESEATLRSRVIDDQVAAGFESAYADSEIAAAQRKFSEENLRFEMFNQRIAQDVTSTQADAEKASYEAQARFDSLNAVAPNQPDVGSVKNLDFIGIGYNIFEGNPLDPSGKVDGGFRFPVVALTYNLGRYTADGQYPLPDYVDVLMEPSTSFTSSFSMFNSEAQYKSQLDESVSIAASIGGGAFGINVEARFSLSQDYQSVTEQTQSSHSTFAQVNGYCNVYRSRLLPGYQLADEFLAAVESLTATDLTDNLQELAKETTYINFVKKYGTHFTKMVLMGGVASQRFTMTESSMMKFQSSLIENNAEAGVSFSSKWVSASASVDLSQLLQSEGQSQMSQMSSSTTEWFMGGVPGVGSFSEDGSTDSIKQWSITVASNPAPLKYELVDMLDLFEDDNLFLGEGSSLNPIALGIIQGNLNAFYCVYNDQSYCPVRKDSSATATSLSSTSLFSLEHKLLSATDTTSLHFVRMNEENLLELAKVEDVSTCDASSGYAQSVVTAFVVYGRSRAFNAQVVVFVHNEYLTYPLADLSEVALSLFNYNDYYDAEISCESLPGFYSIDESPTGFRGNLFDALRFSKVIDDSWFLPFTSEMWLYFMDTATAVDDQLYLFKSGYVLQMACSSWRSLSCDPVGPALPLNETIFWTGTAQNSSSSVLSAFQMGAYGGRLSGSVAVIDAFDLEMRIITKQGQYRGVPTTLFPELTNRSDDYYMALDGAANSILNLFPIISQNNLIDTAYSDDWCFNGIITLMPGTFTIVTCNGSLWTTAFNDTFFGSFSLTNMCCGSGSLYAELNGHIRTGFADWSLDCMRPFAFSVLPLNIEDIRLSPPLQDMQTLFISTEKDALFYDPDFGACKADLSTCYTDAPSTELSMPVRFRIRRTGPTDALNKSDECFYDDSMTVIEHENCVNLLIIGTGGNYGFQEFGQRPVLTLNPRPTTDLLSGPPYKVTGDLRMMDWPDDMMGFPDADVFVIREIPPDQMNPYLKDFKFV